MLDAFGLDDCGTHPCCFCLLAYLLIFFFFGKSRNITNNYNYDTELQIDFFNMKQYYSLFREEY